MSAPDGDLERQAKHHRGPLGGMTFAVIFAAILLVGLLIFTFNRGGAPEGAATQTTATGVVTTEPAGASANDSVAEEAGTAPGTAAVEVEPEPATAPETPADAPAEADPGAAGTATTDN